MQQHGNAARVWIITVAVVALSGCANFTSVTKYAGETKKLSAAFEPMLVGSVQSCVDKYTRKRLITSVSFDAKEVAAKAEAMCKPMAEANQSILVLNDLLVQYSDTLAALANDELPSYTDEFSSVKGKLSELKKSGTDQALIAPEKLNAISSLAQFIAKISTQAASKHQIKQLLEQEDAVFAIVDTFDEYAKFNYLAWLENEEQEMAILERHVDRARQTEPLAANSTSAALLVDKRTIEARKKAVVQFSRSVESMRASHKALRLNFGKLDSQELAKQLSAYAKEINELRKQLRDAL